MGFLDFKKLRKKEKLQKQVDTYFQLMNTYSPVFHSFEGGLYEMELTRSAIHTFATHCSKLKPEVNGVYNRAFARRIQHKMNPNMLTSQYLYKLATMLMVDNTVFIIPLYGDDGNVSAFYPVKPVNAQYVVYDNKDYFRFQLNGGQVAVEKDKVGIMNQFLYDSDFFGRTNDALKPTLELIDTNNQGIINGVKNSANIRFLAKLAMTLTPDDMEAERNRLTEKNLQASNNGGVMIYDQKYENIQQIQSSQYTVDSAQMAQIKSNVYDYFGINEKILQNTFNSNEWAAYYEGKIEPFALQASLVHTDLAFSDTAQSYGNEIIFTANRLQYLSPDEKLNTVTQLFDRGFLTHNMGLEIFNMDTIGEEGDKRYIRKEYAEVSNLDEIIENQPLNEDNENASEE